MMDNDPLALGMLAQSLATFDVALPERAATALAVWQAAQSAAAQAPSDEIRAAMLNGELTPDNVGERIRAAALELTAQEKARTLAGELSYPVRRVAGEALGDGHEQILADLRSRWDAAAKAITDATRHITPTTTATEALEAGVDASDAWRSLNGHASVLSAIATIRMTLATTWRCGDATLPVVAYFVRMPKNTPPHQRYAIGATVLTTDDPLAVASALYDEDSGPGGRWLRLASASYPLRLNTNAEARKVVADATEAQQRHAQAEEERIAREHADRYVLRRKSRAV